ncbi:hypothetical protein ACHAXT_012688 [Thalassiosira profunda]
MKMSAMAALAAAAGGASGALGDTARRRLMGRWSAAAFASLPPPPSTLHTSPSTCAPRTPAAAWQTHRPFSNKDDLPWTPICETGGGHPCHSLSALRMTPHCNTEGFRDAVRGSEEYIKPRGPGRGDAAAQLPQLQSQKVQSPPRKNEQGEPPQSTNAKPSIPFPKLSPGRQRNYRPPHVVSALRANAEIQSASNAPSDAGSGSGSSGVPLRATDKVHEPCDALSAAEREHCAEDFREGRESAGYLPVKGGRGAGEGGGSSPAAAIPGGSTAANSDGDAATGELQSLPFLEDNFDAIDESLSERFREALREPFGRSGSDADSPFEGGRERRSGDGASKDQHEHSLFYDGPSSMNFRDGSRMATFKDDAFRPIASLADLFEDGEDENDSADGELLGGGEAFAEDDARIAIELDGDSTDDEIDIVAKDRSLLDEIRSTGEASSDADAGFSAAKATLLSVDPKSIDIVPLDKGRAAEASADEPPDPKRALLDSLGTDAPSAAPASGSFVRMFRGSASYIANHRATLAVYHIPGELLAWEGFPGLMDDIALTWLLGMRIVLVAGCRHQIDLRLDDEEALAGEGGSGLGGRVMMSSIRVTDEETLRVVKEEAGFVRFEIERRLARSLRLHGGMVKGSDSLVGNVVSGNFYSAQPFGVVDGIDYCWTGFPRKVEVERIRQVHETNDIVLLTSLGVSPSGEIFNVNSEFLAASVAGAMGASKIIYFNVHGTSFQNKVTDKPVQNLRVSDARNLLAHYKMRIHPKGFALVDLDGDSPQQSVLRAPGSMETLIKVGYSMVALEKGVKRAHILAPENGALVQELYTRDGCGTLISRDIYEGIRRADVNDVSGIYDLIAPLVQSGTLVERPRSTLEKEVLSYYVYTRDGLILATGFEGGFAEIGCLVVSKDYRRGGRGDAMLGYLERLALQCGAKKVFVLSTQTMEWFVERGFREVPVESLPPSRQSVYNTKRKSKIYMKEINGDRDLDAAELWWSK